jgi:hypothetical protein
MICPQQYTPEGMEAYAPFHITEWIALWYNGDKYGWLFYEREGAAARIHVLICKWSHNIQRHALRDMELIRGYLRGLGVEHAVVTYTDFGDELLYKFLCLTGWPEPAVCARTGMRL